MLLKKIADLEKYDIVSGFSCGCALAYNKNNLCYGYINYKGNEVIPFIFRNASSFSENLAFVQEEDLHYYVIDINGNKIGGPYQEEGFFCNGFSSVQINGKGTYINEKCEIICQPKYDWLDLFQNGYAVVGVNGKYGVINDKGNEVVPLIYSVIYSPNNHGIAAACRNISINPIDTSTYDCEQIEVQSISNMRVVAYSDEEDKQIYKWGYIDTKGNEITPFIYEQTYCFCENLGYIKRNDRIGFINDEGFEVIAPQYNKANFFSEGLAAVALSETFGYINTSGNVVIPFLYEEANNFMNGAAIVKKNGKFGLIDTMGNVVLDFLYDFIEHDNSSNNIFIASMNGLYGLINNKGVILIPLEYEYLWILNDGTIVVEQNNLYGCFDISGNLLTPICFIEFRDAENGFILLNNGESWGIYTKEKNLG